MKKISLIMLLVFCFLFIVPPVFAQTMTLTTEPSSVAVDLNFKGSKLNISGQVPEGSQVFIKVISPERPVGLSKKGKKAGLWMTVETVNVKGMPAMYKVLSSSNISSLSLELQKQMGIDPDFTFIRTGAQVLEKHDDKSVPVPSERKNEYLDGLVRINSERGLYSIVDNAVKIEGNRYHVTMDIPADVPRGVSEVIAYAVKNGQVVASTKQKLPVSNSGLVHTLGNLAQTNAVAYGVLCIAVALFAGFTIASLFRLLNKYVFKEKEISAHH